MDNYGKQGNCLRGTSCGPSNEWECCVENDEKNGVNGNYGTCCKKGTCMKSGHCKPEGNSVIPKEPFVYEGYSDNDNNCTNWKWAFFLLGFVTLVLACGFIVIGVKLRNKEY